MAESPTTPADPRSAAITFALNVVKTGPASRLGQELVRVVDAMHAAGLLAEGVASLRASGTPGQSVEVVAAEIEAHASQSIPALDLDLIRALASGLSLKEYAAREGLTATTASQRAIRMRQRLGVTSNEQATHEATLRGLLKGVPRP